MDEHPPPAKFRDSEPDQRSRFTRQIIADIDALQHLLDESRFESGVQRLGAEQEFCLIDYQLRPLMAALPVLETLDDEHFTTELAQFNLELNLDPLPFSGNCLSTLESDLTARLTSANRAAHRHGGKIILTGILPTIRSRDLQPEHITPVPRYRALNEALVERRGGPFQIQINGIDELVTSHSNVLFEACNTSFQIHFQIPAQRFAEHYNWARAISAPVLAAAVNSPLFLGRRLWHETRIALFRQSIDARPDLGALRQQHSRVSFGHGWASGSVADNFRDLLVRYRVLLTPTVAEDSAQVIADGGIPKLTALGIHNGTVYRWNRPCYGVTNGIPHLRIENRYLPSGPSIVDEVANAAFWLGLMNAMPEPFSPVDEGFEFEPCRDNFLRAARHGLDTELDWRGRRIASRNLILEELLPLASQGLAAASVDETEASRYLGIIESRVSSGQTGARWLLDSAARLKPGPCSDEVVLALTEGIYQRQKSGQPVHRWSFCELAEGGDWRNRYATVAQIMSSDLITLEASEPVALAQNLMAWSDIHHLPIEGKGGRLLGLLSIEQLLGVSDPGQVVADLMRVNPPTIGPDVAALTALNLMRTQELSCLPVVEDDKLVGILTDRDFVRLAAELFSQPPDS